jgi:uncharacterized protein with HEPN domain
MNTQRFQPFTHDNLDLKNELVSLSRSLKSKNDSESHLVSVFIYISIAEYLATHLLDNLRYFVYKGNYYQYAGILSIDERSDNKIRTLGQVISELKKYDFPDKKAILETFDRISKLRNNIFHNLAKVDQNGLTKMLTSDLPEIENLTEDIIEKMLQS